jgi:hypothetical protein
VAICPGVVDTGGKFANLPSMSTTSVANMPLVSTTLRKLVAKFAAGVVDTGVVDIGFEKIPNGPNGILWGLGETDP